MAFLVVPLVVLLGIGLVLAERRSVRRARHAAEHFVVSARQRRADVAGVLDEVGRAARALRAAVDSPSSHAPDR